VGKTNASVENPEGDYFRGLSYFPSEYDTDCTEIDAYNSSTVACVFVAARTCLPSNDGGGGEIYIQIHRQQGDIISLLLFFQNRDGRLKMDLGET
jgi:hypothetical protein